MAQKNDSPADIALKIYNLLQPLDVDDRQRAISAVLTLFGDSAIPTPPPISPPSHPNTGATPILPGGAPDSMAFFTEKGPDNKGEELVVAARFRELHQDAHEHTKEELKAVIDSARRNFDDHNFSRDMNNAKTKGLFNKGTPHKVSYYGQRYVDALPDRDEVKKLRKPKSAARKKGSKKRSSKKKATKKTN